MCDVNEVLGVKRGEKYKREATPLPWRVLQPCFPRSLAFSSLVFSPRNPLTFVSRSGNIEQTSFLHSTSATGKLESLLFAPLFLISSSAIYIPPKLGFFTGRAPNSLC
jgi:hypothetical protein